MEGKTFLVPAIAGILGSSSAALAFCAEVYKVKASEVHMTASGRCWYPNNIAFGMAYAADLALATALVILSVASGCCCQKGDPCTSGNSRQNSSVVAAFASWGVFAVANGLFVVGAEMNRTGRHGKRCTVVRPGVFSAAGALALLSVVLGIYFYVSFRRPSYVQLAGSQSNLGGSVTTIVPHLHEHKLSGSAEL